MSPNTWQQFLAHHFALNITKGGSVVNKNKLDQTKENTTLTQRLFVERENLCPLCSHQLSIRVKNYLENFTIAEEAFCEHCELVTRTKDHKIN